MDYYNSKHDPTGNCGQIIMHDTNGPPYAHCCGAERMSLLKESSRDEMEIKSQIHRMEKEAYRSVLRAFIAQSDLLSWGKEGLITELRKELNVTDIEHGQLLVEINSDESIKRIREWRQGAHKSLSRKLHARGPAPDSVGNAPPKKRRAPHNTLLASQKYVSHDQPSSTPACFSDVQQSDKLPILSSGNYIQSTKALDHNNIQGSLDGKGRPRQSQSEKGFHEPKYGSFKNCTELIKIRATDKLIHKVERMAYGRKNLDHVQVEKAKTILMAHERAILEALDKLADVSDEDDSPKPHTYPYKEIQGITHGKLVINDEVGQASRLHSCASGLL